MTTPGGSINAKFVRAYDEALKKYGDSPDVTGVDIGFRYVGGRRTRELAVRVHRSATTHEPSLVAPRGRRAAAGEPAPVGPLAIDGVPVDVVRARYRAHAEGFGAAAASNGRTSRVDPIQPGVSISHQFGSGGTLGLIVYDAESREKCLLSNYHVLFGTSTAKVGDWIVQPSSDHRGRVPPAAAGRIARGYRDAEVDAAIAVLETTRGDQAAQFGTNVLINRARRPRIGALVEKSGARTGTTRGIVDGLGQYYFEDGGERPMMIKGFRIVTEEEGNPRNVELSRKGDSGAVWYLAGSNVGVGLHVAGEVGGPATEEHAIACYLGRVLNRLRVRLTPA